LASGVVAEYVDFALGATTELRIAI
jgi:hypothetical protein